MLIPNEPPSAHFSPQCIGLMFFGLFVFRLQVLVCQGVIVLSCIVIRPTLPSEPTIYLDGMSSNPLEPRPDG